MNEKYNVKMNDDDDEKKKEKKMNNLIKKKCYIFPQFSDKNYEIGYDMIRIYNIEEFICIHLVVSISIILIECFMFYFKKDKNNASTIENLVVIFSILNCLMHVVVLIKICLFSSKKVYTKNLFLGYLIINQIFQFLSLYFFTQKNQDNRTHAFSFYNNKFSLYLHFFIDSVFLICLPTLKFFLTFIFVLIYLTTNIILIALIKFNDSKNEVEFYYIYILSVVLVMFFILRLLMEKRNRILLYMIKDILSNNQKPDEYNYDKETNSITVDITKDKYEDNSDNSKFFSDKSTLFNDFTLNACYKDYFSIFYFIKKLSPFCDKNKNTKEKNDINNDIKAIKKHLNESDVLTIAYKTSVLKNIKKIVSEEIGTNWDYSFIDSEYGKSALVILEVGYHLISPYIENNEKKRKKLQLFLLLINSMYFPNPYHNASHGATVCHLSKCLAHITEYDKHLNNTYMICYLIASIAHDVGHPGKTNAYLSDINHILSIRYNDMSILENYHCSITFSILQLIGFDFLINDEDTKLVEKNNYTNIRKFIIELIIATDMKLHFEYVDIFKKRKKSENFDISDRDAINLGTINIKLADIGHTCLKWKDHAKWTMLVSEEFFSQKKLEELNKQKKNTDFNNIGGDEYIDESMAFNCENIYINYANNINNANKYDFSCIKLDFIHSHDFVKSIPSTQVYFFEIIVIPLIQEIQSMERNNKDITQKVLHNLNINLKIWHLIEKNINLFYNTEKMKVTDYYKNLEKKKLLKGGSLLDINEEDVISLSGEYKEKTEEKPKEISDQKSETKKKNNIKEKKKSKRKEKK